SQRLARARNHRRAPILYRLSSRLKFVGALVLLLYERNLLALQRQRFRLSLELQTLAVADFFQQRDEPSRFRVRHGHSVKRTAGCDLRDRRRGGRMMQQDRKSVV